MIKRTIKETTELIEKITREETETEDKARYPLQSPTYPSYPSMVKYNTNNPYTINCSSECKTDRE